MPFAPSSARTPFTPTVLLLVLLLLFRFYFCRPTHAAKLLFQLDGPQPCPQNPIKLSAQPTPQYIYSPYDEQRNYLPDTDCQFLIEASSRHHRIHMTVQESDLEEALFTECDDYVSVRDRQGDETSAKEVVRWCGQEYPAAITSASDSLLVHFHSDSVIQKRGFNISFVEFELPGCPPSSDWYTDSNSPFCYKLFLLPHILPWFDAQKECTFERANLATFQDDSDYGFVVAQFSQLHSYPWIGYTDTNVEGVFEAADRSVPLWPEKFPLKVENEGKDCVYLDWTKRDPVVYETDDCRLRRPFLCKKRKDGTEVPVVLPAGMIRRGFRDFSIDYSLLVAVIVLLLLVLVVGCLLYQKLKERENRVVNVDLNQRLVQGSGTLAGGSIVQQRSNVGGVKGSSQKSLSEQKTKAALSLAKEKAKERERREREQKYEQKGRNVPAANNTPKPLETQDSTASFPLRTFQYQQQIYPEQAQQQQQQSDIEERPMAMAGGEMDRRESTQSPRISLSPNQPEPREEDNGRNGGEYEERGEERHQRQMEEEEEDRRNMGYEPDSEEEEEGTERERERRRRRAEEEEKEGTETRQWPDEEERQGQSARRREGEEPPETEVDQQQEKKKTEANNFSLRQNQAQTEQPVRPPIELLRAGEAPKEQRREKEKEKEQTGGAAALNREGTMLSTGQQTMVSTQSAGTAKFRVRRKSFDRPPPVGPLDSVSAISLDEFWQQK